MYSLYFNIIFRPLYNGLAGLMDIAPWMDLGLAVIVFTVIVKFALFHLSKSSIITQIKMKEIEPESNRIKEQYKNDKQAQALKVMELYRTRGVKPFAGILLIFIQLPILLALISVFYKIIPTANPEYLYSFVSNPIINTKFLGIIDLIKPSLVLALLTGIAQYFQLQYSLASKQFKPANVQKNADGTPPLDFAASMNKQMKFMLPIFAFASTYWIIPASFPQAASIIAIYWTVSTLFTLFQELYIRKQYAKKARGN